MDQQLWQQSRREAEAHIGGAAIGMARYLFMDIEPKIRALTMQIYQQKLQQRQQQGYWNDQPR